VQFGDQLNFNAGATGELRDTKSTAGMGTGFAQHLTEEL
jgi:hypothetical protein